MEKIKKRFIAGAKCPKCNAIDSIVVFKHNNIETVECNECDYHEQQTDGKTSGSQSDIIGIFKQ